MGPPFSLADAHQRAQAGQVLYVFLEIFPLGSFQTGRVCFETRIVDDVTEGLYSQLAAADMRVAIDMGSEIGFGVIQMKCHYGVNAN